MTQTTEAKVYKEAARKLHEVIRDLEVLDAETMMREYDTREAVLYRGLRQDKPRIQPKEPEHRDVIPIQLTCPGFALAVLIGIVIGVVLTALLGKLAGLL